MTFSNFLLVAVSLLEKAYYGRTTIFQKELIASFFLGTDVVW